MLTPSIGGPQTGQPAQSQKIELTDYQYDQCKRVRLALSRTKHVCFHIDPADTASNLAQTRQTADKSTTLVVSRAVVKQTNGTLSYTLTVKETDPQTQQEFESKLQGVHVALRGFGNTRAVVSTGKLLPLPAGAYGFRVTFQIQAAGWYEVVLPNMDVHEKKKTP